MDQREEDERNCTGGWADATDQLIENLRGELDFYKRRCDMLQAWQGRMRDPERTIVCDIIANGQTLPDPRGERYGVHNDQVGHDMNIKTANDAVEAYKSLGDWQYADREAAWKWMFEQGRKAAEEDTDRLEWLMRNVSGAEFRRLGVTYGGNCGRDRIDAAMKTPNAIGKPTPD